MRSFRAPEQRPIRTLFRTLRARALASNEDATGALQGERERWLGLFRQALGNDEAAARLMALVLGATLEAIFVDLASRQP